MRKKISIILSLVMLVTLIIPLQVYTEYDKELRKAILKGKELFNITEEYDKFDYDVRNYNGKTQFNLRWFDTAGKLDTINATIDEDGNIIRYNSYEQYYEDYLPGIPKISKSKALEIAKQFIEKVNPDIIDNIHYEDIKGPLSIGSRNYYFNFTRMEEGIPYYDNNISVSVNNMTGKVVAYNFNWDLELEFPDVKDLISEEKAKEIYEEELGLQLVCKFKYDNDEIKPFLVYTTIDNDNVIDAKTGDIIKGSYRYYGTSEEYASEMKTVADRLTPEEEKAIENVANLITSEDAEKTAREFFNIDDTFKINYINLYSNWRNKEEYIWSINFSSEDKRQYMSISLDGKTGEVISFNKSLPYNQDEQVKYDREEALEIAKDYIKSIKPEKFYEVEYRDLEEPIVIRLEEEKPRRYDFRFIRKEGDIYVLEDGFRITVDTVAGEIIGYDYTWYKGELPSTENIIPLGKAYKSLFEKIGMELTYITRYPMEYYPKDEILNNIENQREAKLVYRVKRNKPLNIDVFSGELLNNNGEPYVEKIITQYTDIEGSYAEDKIKILAQYGICLPGKQFRPKSDIKQREFLYLLAKAKNFYLPKDYEESDEFDEALYNRLMREGIIKEGEKSPESLISKEDAVKFIIRLLKYDKVAELEDIFIVPFKDGEEINPNLKGYVAIAYGLKIINGSDGYFNPKSNVTREQGVILVYNLLNIDE